ncbi:hypothetical protein GGR54DRAFT_646349 [Hypoxylon sp. NC1633]|nr:hypothetical protein GGR54DRAFT_646349 [Hypoxylon sp. NC1633]
MARGRHKPRNGPRHGAGGGYESDYIHDNTHYHGGYTDPNANRPRGGGRHHPAPFPPGPSHTPYHHPSRLPPHSHRPQPHHLPPAPHHLPSPNHHRPTPNHHRPPPNHHHPYQQEPQPEPQPQPQPQILQENHHHHYYYYALDHNRKPRDGEGDVVMKHTHTYPTRVFEDAAVASQRLDELRRQIHTFLWQMASEHAESYGLVNRWITMLVQTYPNSELFQALAADPHTDGGGNGFEPETGAGSAPVEGYAPAEGYAAAPAEGYAAAPAAAAAAPPPAAAAAPPAAAPPAPAAAAAAAAAPAPDMPPPAKNNPYASVTEILNGINGGPSPFAKLGHGTAGSGGGGARYTGTAFSKYRQR